MKEDTILKVAAILELWNPLGERANTVEQLNGYRYEAIDIIATYGMMRASDKVAAATKQVLEEAFNLSLSDSDVVHPAREIAAVLGI